MLLVALPHAVGALIIGLALYPFVSYWLDRHHLRKFPSPSIAGFTSLWRIFYNLRQKHYAAVHEAHQKLGTHVRIAPNHVSILDPAAPHEIYGHGANMLKQEWYDAGAGEFRNLADVRDKAEHQRKRKMLAHVFAAKTVVAFEPLLVETLGTFLNQLDSFGARGTKVNMRLYLNYFTIDFFGKLLYGADLGCLSRGDDLLDAETKEGAIYKVPFIKSLLEATIANTVLSMNPSLLPVTRPIAKQHPYKKAGTAWENIVYHNTKKRLSKPERDDLFRRLLKDSQGRELNLPLGELIAETSSMMNAGTETTTAALTNTIYLLYTHPHILCKLREELDAAFPSDTLPTHELASQLPYLRACIEESLRVRPPSSFGLPRIVPKGGRQIAGQFVPEGVTVSVPTYSLLRDETAFDNATEYIPDRWMTDDPEKKRRMMNNHLPFSTGPRACIGRNIAYFEQTVLIATILKFYDCQVPEGFQLETQERFNSNAGDLIVDIQRRRG